MIEETRLEALTMTVCVTGFPVVVVRIVIVEGVGTKHEHALLTRFAANKLSGAGTETEIDAARFS